jgi:hypothetical protein
MDKILLTEQEKRSLVIQLLAEQLAYEKYGGAQKALIDAEHLINKITAKQITTIFVEAAKAGIEVATVGGKPKRYDSLKIVRELAQQNKLNYELDKDAQKVADSSRKSKKERK